MNRDIFIELVSDKSVIWDIIVIGGGATGLATAVDAAARGYKTLLVEQYDFAKGTSSRSTKLVHGGVRYLQQGDISLVLEALQERGLLLQNAPHLVSNQSFVIPNYEWWEGPFYTLGLKVYDMMAGKLGLGPSLHLSMEEVIKNIPNLKREGLQGGVIYHDGQFDDARLAINLAQTCVDNGGVVLNYFPCIALSHAKNGLIDGIIALDQETGIEYHLKSKVVVNATGVWVDSILQMDNFQAKKTIIPSQGVHIVLDKSFLSGDDAIMIPHTDDGRVLFAVPWHNKVIVGTTDTLVNQIVAEPVPLQEEIDFILNTAGHYLTKSPTRRDIKSMFAGLRPLSAPAEGEVKTKEISRSHKISVSLSGLISVTGGKWTTCRKMAEEIIDKAMLVAGLPEVPCNTRNMPIHGAIKNVDRNNPLHFYGSDAGEIFELMLTEKTNAQKLSDKLPYTKAEVIWAVKHEMACTVEDVLARRMRALFLDARESIAMANETALIMASLLNKDKNWVTNQVEKFTELARNYLPVL